MRQYLPYQVGHPYAAMGSVWHPTRMFRLGEQGLVWDPRDMSGLFLDTAGASPATAFGQPIARVADLTGNGHHLAQGAAGLRPVLVDTEFPRLHFDSSCLATINTIDFSSTPAITLIMSFRKTTDGASAIVAELSENGYTTNGAFYISAPNSSGGAADYGLAAKGSLPAYATYNEAMTAAPAAHVLVAELNISQGTLDAQLKLLINGTERTRATVGTGLGTGNFGNHTMFFGMRNAASIPLLKGTIGRTILIGRALTLEEKALSQSWVGVGSNTVVAAVGDSTVCDYIGGLGLTRHVDCVGAIIAVAGDTIAEQKADWIARADKATFGVVVVQVGLNDLAPGEAASVAIARLQDLINTINTDVTVPVYVAQMTPCRSRLITIYGGTNGPIAYQKWLDMNAAIAGNGATPITGVDGRITAHVALMGDGLGNLLPAYDTGDGIHPNNLGRAVTATAWSRAIGHLL